jgi:diadenosine tetraphosphatase ApaH/serine/threonine PP2A family protein phosphatase
MRYLVISDVHANLEALTAVLETSASAWDEVLVLGDLVGYGGDPNAVIDRIKALPVAGLVRGNHDKVACGLDSMDSFNHVARQAIEWTMRVLTPENQRWLKELPRGPLPVDALTAICHGAPWDEDAYLFDERDVERSMPLSGPPLCLFGHTHVPSIFRAAGTTVEAMLPIRGERCKVSIEEGQRYLVNCGAVGQPRDGDPRAAYGLLDSKARVLTLVRTPYDVTGAQGRILAAGLPPVLAQRLALGR